LLRISNVGFRVLENSMAYTVKQLAAISGVSIRTLHFYDETGLLAPAYHGANGYRFYEEPQLLTLQQILFYRELGFELKQIKQMLGRADFENIAALRSHRQVLEESLKHTHQLMETIDKTIEHLVRLLHFMRPSRPRFPVVVGFFGTLARGGPMSKPVAVC